MDLSLSRALKRSASTLAITAAALALAGCGGATLSNDDSERAAAILETAAPDTKDHVGGAAYWGAKYEASREDTGAALNFARNLRMMGGARQAVAVLKDVVMKLPDDARVMAEYGKALAAAGRAKDALPFLSRSIHMKGDDWTTLSAYGVALDQTGNHATAGEMYQAALTISPNNPVIESNLAMSMVLQGRVDQAELTLRRLVARPDATAQMRQNLAMIETLKGNVVEAEQLAREDLPPGQATSNIAVLRQLDARNARINAEPLAPPAAAPKLSAPAPAASATTPAKGATAAPTSLTQPSAAGKTSSPASPTATPAKSAATAVPPPASAPKAARYKMLPIADDPPVKPASSAAPAETAPAKQSDAAATPKTKPVAFSQPPKNPVPALRQSYDIYRKSSPVSVANAAQ